MSIGLQVVFSVWLGSLIVCTMYLCRAFYEVSDFYSERSSQLRERRQRNK